MSSKSDIAALKVALAALDSRVTKLEKAAPPIILPPPPPPSAFKYPADVVGKGWKVTLEDGSDVTQPKLATYSDTNFKVSDDGRGAQMRCHYDAGHTPTSQNSRCEWREMSADGSKLASWSTTSGHHQLTHTFRVDRLYDIRPITVLAQIHDSANDLTVFRLESSNLYITNGNATHTFLVSNGFTLGINHSVGFDVQNGIVSYTFDGKVVPFTQSIKASGVYFRSGNYGQANKSTAPGGLSSDYSQVTTLGLTVSHT